jgi:hypothetical protein
MARKKDLMGGYQFTFGKVSGDFSSRVNINEYVDTDTGAKELIISCKDKEYNFSTDVDNFSNEENEVTKTGTSLTKTLGKLALAGAAGKSAANRSYGSAAMLGSLSQDIDTDETKTITFHNVMIEFKDGKLLMLSEVSSKEWSKLEEAYNVFNYLEYREEVGALLSIIESEEESLRATIGSVSSSDKQEAMQKIELLQKLSQSTKKQHSDTRKKAIKRMLVHQLSDEEQADVDRQQSRKGKTKKELLGEDISRYLSYQFPSEIKPLEQLTDYQFARKFEYRGLKPHATLVHIGVGSILSIFSSGALLLYPPLRLFMIGEYSKWKTNKESWSEIEKTDANLTEVKAFRKNKMTQLTSDSSAE